MADSTFILASSSPRRAQLLAAAGYRFTIRSADVDETDYPPTATPIEVVLLLAHRKATAVAKLQPGMAILAADTIVVLDGQMIGKPNDADHARSTMRALAGRTHEVISGVAVLGSDGIDDMQSVISKVAIKPMSEDAIETYIQTGRWRGKAGGYGLQDEKTIAELIAGCRTNVIGLPMTTTRRLLAVVGIEPSASA